MLEELITSGRIIDLMVLFVVLEVCFLLALRHFRGGGIATIPLLTNIGAGGSLMLALRANLMDNGWSVVAFFLVLSLVFHVSDVGLRWREHRASPGVS